MEVKTATDSSQWKDRNIAPLGASVLTSLLIEAEESLSALGTMWNEAPVEFVEEKFNEIDQIFKETLENSTVHKGVLQLSAAMRPACHPILDSLTDLVGKLELAKLEFRQDNLDQFIARCTGYHDTFKSLSSSVSKIRTELGSVKMFCAEITTSRREVRPASDRENFDT